MLLLSRLAGKPALLAATKSHFASRGWTILPDILQQTDVIVKKSGLRFRINCISADILNFRSYSDLISIQLGLAFRNGQDRGLIAVLDFYFPIVLFDELAKLGVVFVHVDELAVITNLEILQLIEIKSLCHRARLLLRANTEVCLRLSDSGKHAGDLLLAIDWAEHALRGDLHSVAIHLKLSKLYIQVGDLPNARKVTLRGLDNHPRDQRLIHAMIIVCTQSNDKEEEASWRRRLSTETERHRLRASDKVLSFQEMMALQKNTREARSNIPTRIETGSTNISPEESGEISPLESFLKKGFFARLATRFRMF